MGWLNDILSKIDFFKSTVILSFSKYHIRISIQDISSLYPTYLTSRTKLFSFNHIKLYPKQSQNTLSYYYISTYIRLKRILVSKYELYILMRFYITRSVSVISFCNLSLYNKFTFQGSKCGTKDSLHSQQVININRDWNEKSNTHIMWFKLS